MTLRLRKTDQNKFRDFLKEKRTVSMASFRFMPETFDEASRTVKLVATTNYPYKIMGWFMDYEEVLEISEQAIDLGRLKAGKTPLLKNHKNDIDCVLGRIIDYQIEKAETPIFEMAPADMFKETPDRLVVTVHFDDDEYNNKYLLPKVKSGSIGNVSIGYRIHEYELFEGPDAETLDRIIARNWELLEVSLVAVPADYLAGVRGVDNDDKRINHISKHNSGENNVDEAEKKKAAEELKAAVEAEKKKAAEELKAALEAKEKKAEEKRAKDVVAERARVAAITKIANETGLDNLEKLIEDGATVEEVRTAGYEAMKKKLTDVNPIVELGNEGDDVKAKDFQDAFLNKMRHAVKPELEKGNEFVHMPILMAMKKFVDQPWMSSRQFYREYLGQNARVVGQGSFPALIEDAVNRNLNESYKPRTNPFADIVQTEEQMNLHSNKKRRFDIDLEPDPVMEGEDIPIAKSAGEGNEIDIVKYGKGFSITEEAILNDDLGGFDRIFMYLGHGLTQRETRLIANLLFNPASLFDGAALYSSDRSNLVTGAAGGVITSNVKLMRTAMRKQTTPAGKPADIFPSFIICGEDLAEDARAFLNARIVPRILNEEVEVHRDGITKLIVHPYIDGILGDKSETDFLLAANPMMSMIPVVSRIIHSDVRVPEIESVYNVEKSSRIYYSRFYLGMGLGDYRGLTRFSQS